MNAPHQPNAPQQPMSLSDKIVAGAIFALVAGVLIYTAIMNAGSESESSPDPCSDEVMEAPYEVDLDNWERDQYGERVAECLGTFDSE